MKNYLLSKLNTFMMLLAAAAVTYSCSLENISEDLQNAQKMSETDLENSPFLMAPAGSCEADCIEAGSEIYYPVSDLATGSAGPNTKSVSYKAYNTETDFVVEVTYAITAGRSRAKARITIAIDGDGLNYTSVRSGHTVKHTVPLPEGWSGCDEISFSIEQKGLGTPITFNESYSFIPVCSEVLEIGRKYQGGIIAYIFQPGDPGYVPSETHGIIAAPSDQGSAAWEILSGTTGATGTALGTGQANTTAIVNTFGAGSYAAQLCNGLESGGYSDWYLPSKDELNQLYLNKDAVGGFANFLYWSSSEFSLNLAWNQAFTDGAQNANSKFLDFFLVRAVRSF
ncbi:DUF1566 domain-containing protein [Cyclobacterium plantarum]|uniref:Lcl C-terminal domain-containing protein n=1 Tax=Cyclobacterium plantarum TaxID=2716263 RepID=UPI003F70746E